MDLIFKFLRIIIFHFTRFWSKNAKKKKKIKNKIKKKKKKKKKNSIKIHAQSLMPGIRGIHVVVYLHLQNRNEDSYYSNTFGMP